MYLRRIGPVPVPGTTGSGGANGCPDIWELESGDFAVIGFINQAAVDSLPPEASIDVNEALVVVPRHVLAYAKRNLPDPAPQTVEQ